MTRAGRIALTAACAIVASLVAVFVSLLSIGVGHSSGLLWVGQLVLPYMVWFLHPFRGGGDKAWLLIAVYFVLPVLQAVAYTLVVALGTPRARLILLAVHGVASGLSFALLGFIRHS